MQWVKIATAILGLSIASPALAQKVATFSVGGADYEVPIPEGFCLPAGATETAARVLEKADAMSQTHLSLFACDYETTGKDYYLVKTPVAVVSAPITRAQLLPELRRQSASPEVLAQITPDKVNNQTGTALSGAMGRDVNVDVKLAPRGSDDVCAYMSGVMNYEVEGTPFKVEISGCLSAVGNRVIFVFYYHDGDDPAAALRNMAKARALLLSIRATGGNR